jgi:hypothetical protein
VFSDTLTPLLGQNRPIRLPAALASQAHCLIMRGPIKRS